MVEKREINFSHKQLFLLAVEATASAIKQYDKELITKDQFCLYIIGVLNGIVVQEGRKLILEGTEDQRDVNRLKYYGELINYLENNMLSMLHGLGIEITNEDIVLVNKVISSESVAHAKGDINSVKLSNEIMQEALKVIDNE